MARALLLLMAWPLLGAAPAPVDHLGLATVLLRDGHVDRADRVLDQVATEAPAFDRARFETLRGLVRERQGRWAEALAAFDAAVAAGGEASTLHAHRAQCAFRLDDCATTLSALDVAGEAGRGHPDLFTMRASCQWRAERHDAAFAALDAGARAFPTHRAFARTRVVWLLELGLHQAAIEAGRAASDGSLEDALLLAEALIHGGRPGEARALLEAAQLEAARLRHGETDLRLRLQLAHAWLGSGHPVAAARQFEQAALLDPTHARDAAEVYREHGMPGRALALNARVRDPEAKLRQRVAILLDLERYEGVTALEPRLERLGLLEEDEALRYALAFAWYRAGEPRRAEAHLRRLTDAALFDKAAGLRAAMAACAAGDAPCD
ncbi:MAG: tetratricopeptide repeat protein [Myxococcales bacterium]|nr:tetratricopeptide repeat protein [Myxococcales bacterium]